MQRQIQGGMVNNADQDTKTKQRKAGWVFYRHTKCYANENSLLLDCYGVSVSQKNDHAVNRKIQRNERERPKQK